MQTLERRRTRSSEPSAALGFFLASERARGEAKALVLSTLDGHPVACAGTEAPDAIAAAAALKLAGLGSPRALGTLARERFVLTVVHGADGPFLLTQLGGSDRPRTAEPHLERILALGSPPRRRLWKVESAPEGS